MTQKKIKAWAVFDPKANRIVRDGDTFCIGRSRFIVGLDAKTFSEYDEKEYEVLPCTVIINIKKRK